MAGWMIVICIALFLYAIKAGNGALKALMTGQSPSAYREVASSNPRRDRRLCALVDLLAVPGTLEEAAVRSLAAAIAGVMRYLWQQFVKSAKALFAPPV